MRYFVRSYVTSPTTIRAITDIPANTPRPIGKTDNFFPGSVKAAWEDELAAAAEAAEAAEEAEAAESAAEVAEVGADVVELSPEAALEAVLELLPELELEELPDELSVEFPVELADELVALDAPDVAVDEAEPDDEPEPAAAATVPVAIALLDTVDTPY